MSHVVAVGIANSHGGIANSRGANMVANSLLASQVIWISIYSPRSSRRKSSCFTRQTTSHPAHTSNLGKVGTVPYRLYTEGLLRRFSGESVVVSMRLEN